MSEFNDLLRCLDKPRSKARKFCEPLMHHFGVNEFIYQTIKTNGDSLGINLNMDWMDYYFSEQMYRLDPLASHPNNHQQGLLSSGEVVDKSAVMLLDAAKKHFGIHFSFLLSNKISDGFEFFVFGTTSSAPSQILKFYNEISLIRGFAKRFKEEFKNEILKVGEYHINFAKLKGPDFQTLPFQLISQPINREKFLEKLGVETPKPLTAKELAVVKQLIKGFSASKIADHLLLSPRTVEHHLERIKDKYDCMTKAELIQKVQKFDAYGYFSLQESIT